MESMGYQVMAGAATENLTDEVWLDVISLASRYGYSAPRLSNLGSNEEVYLTNEEVLELHAALVRALSTGGPAQDIATEEDTLDRDTVRRVDRVLRQQGLKILRRTPS